MRGFRKLVMLGVLLVTLLLVIDTIDAGKKQGKKKELETGKSYNGENPKSANKIKHTESTKQDKVKKTGSQNTENFVEEDQYVNKASWFDSKKPDVKKNMKFAQKDKKYIENESSKMSKHYQKFKKSKILEEDPLEKFSSGKSKVKKTKPQYLRSENVDKIFKTVKKTTQKKLIEENENAENTLNEELNKLKNEEIISVEETAGANSKKRKYKLVEVVLQEDGQGGEQEENEAKAELGLEDQEFVNILSEEIAEKTRTQNPKYYKYKKTSKKSNIVEEDQNEDLVDEDYYLNDGEEPAEPELSDRTASEADSFAARYDDPGVMESCRRFPEDPNRKGPKKLTLYVIEEEVNGVIKKRVASEEDGVTMCEVADLLKETYRMDIPEE